MPATEQGRLNMRLPSRCDHPQVSLLNASLREIPGVLNLSFPIILGLVSSTLIGVVDTIMIAPLGTHAMAAASITTSSLIILYSALYGLISVVQVRLAQAKGADDFRLVSARLKNGIALGIFAGVLAASMMLGAFPLLHFLNQSDAVMEVLLPYWIAKSIILIPYALLAVYRGLFNSIDRAWASTAIAILAMLINIPLNYILIGGAFGWPGLGLLGAGIGSVLASSIALVTAWAYWRYGRSLAPYRQHAHLSLKQVARSFTEGIPVAVSNLAEGASYALAGLMLGFFGPAALAANQIVHSIAAIMYMLPVGMAAAVSIRIGQAVGSNEYARLHPIGIAATGSVLCWMAAFFVLLAFFRDDISAALTNDPEVFAIAVTMFLTIAFTQFADGLQSTALGALRGLVDIRVPTLITLSAYWLIALPAAYWLGFRMELGPNGVWIGYGMGIFIAAIALQLRLWMKTRSCTIETPIHAGAWTR